MKLFIALLGFLFSFAADAAQTDSFPPCEVEYLVGIEFMEQGEHEAAAEAFFKAIRLAPQPEADPAYIPYVYLSAAHYELGNIRAARDALIQSQVYGVAPETENGRLLLERYAAKIMSAPLDSPEFVAYPQSSPVSASSYSLSLDEVELIRSQVLKRCSVSSQMAENKLPWYFYYEFGVELLKAGDPERAVEAFVLGANVREDPSRNKRMYGMWYIDYLPYYQLALAHSKLGNWESARDAIETSENFGEFSPDDSDYESFTSLSQLIQSNLQQGDS